MLVSLFLCWLVGWLAGWLVGLLTDFKDWQVQIFKEGGQVGDSGRQSADRTPTCL